MRCRWGGDVFLYQPFVKIWLGGSGATSALLPIVLQKSKVAPVQIFGENHKRKEVDDFA